jgi:hypothetical protein
MTPKKIAGILALLEISQNNLKIAKEQLMAYSQEKGYAVEDLAVVSRRPINNEEYDALEVVEGFFDGESMIGDNGKTYPVPPNYASKTQLIMGDRMKRILTTTRESFKLIKPAERERVVGIFDIQGDTYLVVVDGYALPVRVLKASATFAMKNLGLQPGDSVAVIIPKEGEPIWGALSSIISGEDDRNEKELTPSPYAQGNMDAAPKHEFDASKLFGDDSNFM